MKKNVFLAILLVVSFGVFIPEASAADIVSFSFKTNYSWMTNINNAPSTKDSGNHFSAVKWTESDKPNHKMWFRVINNSGQQQGEAGLLAYLTTDAFKTNLTSGEKYYLQARRENFLDPVTTISGVWAA